MARKPFTNDFSWSVSRAALFQKCQKAYYFNYYGSWGGWNADAPQLVRQTYILKQIKSLAMWAGTIVHDTIKETLLAFSRGEIQFPTIEEIQNTALLKMRAGWRDAVAKKYLQYPKSTNLFELYYSEGDGTSLPKEQTDEIKSIVLECLANFVTSPVVADIKNTPFANWKSIDELDTFFLDDLKVWGAPDFAYMDNNGIFHIIDWKTGTEDKDALGLQLACYTLYSMEKWNITDLARIQLHGVFLKDGGRKSNYPVSAENLISAKDIILTSAQAMKNKLTDKENNTADEENFPCNPSPFACSMCPFRQICPAANGLE